MNKKIVSYLVFLLICLVPFNVKAECSDEELKSLKEEANKIKITYEYDEDVVTDGTITLPKKEKRLLDSYLDDVTDEEKNNDGENVEQKGAMTVVVSGMIDKFYIEDTSYGYKYDSEDFIENNMIVIYNPNGGKTKFNIYSSSCGDIVRTITVNVPKFNQYYLDPLCEGINGGQLSVCDKWYNYEVDYDTFVRKVTQYKDSLKDIEEKKKKEEEEKFVEQIKEFFEEYYLYFVVGILLIIAIVVVIKVRRKRSELE